MKRPLCLKVTGMFMLEPICEPQSKLKHLALHEETAAPTV